MTFAFSERFSGNVCELSNVTSRGINQGHSAKYFIRVSEHGLPLKVVSPSMVSSAHRGGSGGGGSGGGGSGGGGGGGNATSARINPALRRIFFVPALFRPRPRSPMRDSPFASSASRYSTIPRPVLPPPSSPCRFCISSHFFSSLMCSHRRVYQNTAES